MVDIKNLDKLEFSEAYNKIIQVTKAKEKFSDKELIDIMSLEDKDLLVLFIEGIKQFSKEQTILIEKFINQSMLDENREFVSDLIYIAKDWSLNLSYDLVLANLRSISAEEQDVVLASVYYISENVKFGYINEIFSAMKEIVSNSSYYQNAQILASICLFRISHDLNYLLDIKGWFVDSVENVEFVKNYLELEFFQKPYFSEDVKEILLGNVSNYR